jgi:hypothetical protein
MGNRRSRGDEDFIRRRERRAKRCVGRRSSDTSRDLDRADGLMCRQLQFGQSSSGVASSSSLHRKPQRGQEYSQKKRVMHSSDSIAKIVSMFVSSFLK